MQRFVGKPINPVVNLISGSQCNGMKVLEIGAYDGSTTIGYADIVKKNGGTIFILDTFMGTKMSDDFLEKNKGYTQRHSFGPWNNDLFDKFRENMADYMDIIIPIVGDSAKTLKLLPNRSMDIIFIDGDHKYSAVKQDILLSLEKLKNGGLMCGHDCLFRYDRNINFTEQQLELETNGIPNYGHCGVIKAVYDIFGENYEQTPIEGGVWWTQVFNKNII